MSSIRTRIFEAFYEFEFKNLKKPKVLYLGSEDWFEFCDEFKDAREVPELYGMSVYHLVTPRRHFKVY